MQKHNDMANKKTITKSKLGDSEKLFSQMLTRLNAILEKYMAQYPRYNELKAFMQDENNLYNEDGSIKDKYKEWIEDVEDFSSRHSVKEVLAEFHKGDSTWSAVYEGIERYVSSNKELLSLYEKAAKEEGVTFDVEEWIYDQIRSSSKDDKEADEKFDTLAKMFSNETLNLLDSSSELRKRLKDRIEDAYGAE